MAFGNGNAIKYRRPIELTYYAGLSLGARKGMLLDWADEANAQVADTLSRRDPRTGRLASLDEIRDALALLDEEIARRAPRLETLLMAAPPANARTRPETAAPKAPGEVAIARKAPSYGLNVN